MSAPAARAPRFATYVAGAAMAYMTLWGVIRTAVSGFHPPALAVLVLLCASFLLARRGGEIRACALCAGVLALGGIGVALVARGGSLSAEDVWATSAVACIALLLIWRAQHVIAWATMLGLCALLAAVGGLAQLEELGVLTTVLTLGVIAAAGRVLGRYDEQMQQYSATEREALEWRIAQDAYQQAHQQRIEQTGRLASPMLELIAAGGGVLDARDRHECRVLHQSIRDETRGRLLLNDAVREHVRSHRRRGATVQLLDDGQLGRLDAAELSRAQNEIAEQIAPLTSDRIIIRSGMKDGRALISVVATSVDAIAAALGEEGDDQVDLWHEIDLAVREPVTMRARR